MGGGGGGIRRSSARGAPEATFLFFCSSRRRHTRFDCDWSSDVCSSDLVTGSGKSTALAAMINHINTNRRVNIITIEDPIEFLHRDNLANISQREVGNDTLSFNAALRHVLRQAPDVILIGEIRDMETLDTALKAADTGHLVVSTLHTTDSTQTINRVI